MPDWTELYRQISRARAFELATAQLWQRGSISGEMHLGTGEEVLIASLVSHLRSDDSVAVDHRPSPVFVTRGVDLYSLFAEMLGHDSGLCGGRGGHMHFFCDEPLTVSSGIVGSAGPAAAGFALASRSRGSDAVAVAFFGDGAANQGMLLESVNLAAAWRLPVVFVCKDNGWAITTRSEEVTGGDLADRWRAFGLPTWRVDGGDLAESVEVGARAVSHARSGEPAAIVARVPRLQGHFLGYKVGRIADHLTSGEAVGQVASGVRALAGKGTGLRERAGGLVTQMKAMLQTRGEHTGGRDDPVVRAREVARARGVDVAAVDESTGARVARAAREALEATGAAI